MKKFVKVPLKEYIQLVNDQNELEALDQNGVDNWGWYGDALKDLEEFTESEIGYDIIEE